MPLIDRHSSRACVPFHCDVDDSRNTIQKILFVTVMLVLSRLPPWSKDRCMVCSFGVRAA
jgi:hypothetical protein